MITIMRTNVVTEFVHQFKGSYPSVDLSTDVNLGELTEGDESPFFVTLPIGKVGTRSKNNRTYSREAVEAIVNQIKTKKPGGNLGHMKDDERAYKFDLPVLMWVGATLDDEGTAWGKAYVPSYATNVREYLKRQMKLNARVATSIFGTADVDDSGNVGADLEIETIDLADPERAGVPEAVAVPIITTEMQSEESTMQYAELMAERDSLKAELDKANAAMEALKANADAYVALREMESDPAKSIRELTETKTTLTTLVGENWVETIQGWNAERKELSEQLGTPDLKSGIDNLKGQLETTIAENKALLKDSLEGMLMTVKVEKARPMIQRLVNAEAPQTREALKTAFDAVLEMTEVKEMLAAMVIETMGEPIRLSGKVESDNKPKFTYIEGGK